MGMSVESAHIVCMFLIFSALTYPIWAYTSNESWIVQLSDGLS